MPLRAGILRQKVDIQSLTETSDGAGGKTKTWATTTAGVPAEVIPQRGGEAFAQGLARNTQLYQVTVRYRTGLSPRNRLLWNGTVLNIKSCADPDNGKREQLVMDAESGTPDP